jgi:hypothetical protein
MRWWIGLRSALLVCGLSLAGVAQAADEELVTWHDNYKEALREAKKTNKPIFLEFRCEP